MEYLSNITIVNSYHKQLLLVYLKIMFSLFSPKPCLFGYFCLQGVASTNLYYTNLSPQLCMAGFFCLQGASSAAGSGLCPSGYYCPEGTINPIITPTGTFTIRYLND